MERVGHDHLVGVDARERGGEFAGAAFGDHELRGGDVDPGQRDAVASGGGACSRQRQQVIVGLGIEQRVFGQRSRSDEAGYIAANHALVAALARRGRILGLLAHRDAVAERDQPMQVIVRALHRNAAHRDVCSLVLAAFGQRDAQRAGRDFGILKKQFVEIAHPVEQQQAGIGRLDFKVLFHHRRDSCRLGGGGGARRCRDGALDRHGGETTKFRRRFLCHCGGPARFPRDRFAVWRGFPAVRSIPSPRHDRPSVRASPPWSVSGSAPAGSRRPSPARPARSPARTR